MDDQNFDLLIERDGDFWKARVIGSPAGEASNQFELPFLIEKWQKLFTNVARSNLRERVKTNEEAANATEVTEQIKSFGSQLFKAVFSKEIEKVFRASIEAASREKFELRLRLRLDDSELNKLPWEYLYDPNDERFIVLSAYTPILRYLELPQPVKALETKPPLQILVVVSNPKDSADLNVEKEWEILQEAVQEIEKKGLLKLTKLESPTLIALQEELDLNKVGKEYHALHFIGHGGFDKDTGQGTLIFEDKNQKSHSVSSEQLGTILDDHDSLRLAFLNACEGARSEGDSFTGVAQTLVKRGISAVIAMQFKITDNSAITLAQRFYEGLAAGRDVDTALTIARKSIFVQGSLQENFEWGTPVLFMRSSEGHLFDIKDFEALFRDVPSNPYQGLAAFREEDQVYFFGRQRATQELLNAINEKPLVALIGNSGSGKSSLVFAGLAPKLREKEWLITSFRPQSDPFYQLAASLVEYVEAGNTTREKLQEIRGYARDLRNNELQLSKVIENITKENNQPLVLIIDQFEEIFTLNPNKEVQNDFLGQLTKVTKKNTEKFRLLLTMRSDFMSYALNHSEFGQALSQSTLMLTPMNREELYQVIEGPARKQGVTLEVGLTESILDDVLSNADQQDYASRLPLLEFALTLLWDKQEKLTLTHKGYQAIGKVEGALARHAEKVFNQYTPQEQIRLKHIFTQLVRPGEGTEDTRQVGTKEQIGEQNWQLVTKLASERLVITDQAEDTQEETVEVIHEALIRSWQRLGRWVNTDRDFRVWQNRLQPTIKEWQESNFDRNLLLRGRQLLQAEEYLQSHKDQLKTELDFIQASNAYKEEELRKKRQRQLIISTSAVIVLILAMLTTFLGVNINILRNRALASKVSTQALFKQTEAEDEHSDLAILLALQSLQFAKDENSYSRVIKVLQNQSNPFLYASFRGHYNSTILDISYSNNSNLLASISDNGKIVIYDVKEGKVHPKFKVLQISVSNTINDADFSPDNQFLAVGQGDRKVSFWEVETAKQLSFSPLTGHSNDISEVLFNSDGTRLATADSDGGLIIWDTKTGEQIYGLNDLKSHEESITSLIFSNQDSQYLASVDKGNKVVIWDLINRDHFPIENNDTLVKSLTFSVDSTLIAIAYNREGTSIWDIKTSKLKLNLINDVVEDIAFHPNGKLLLESQLNGGDINVWNLETEEILETISGYSGSSNMEFSPDGNYFASTTSGTRQSKSEVVVWDTSTWKKIRSYRGHSDIINKITFSPEGKTLATSDRNGSVMIWNLEAGKMFWRLLGGRNTKVYDRIFDVEFSPDGNIVAAGNSGITLLNAQTGKMLKSHSKQGSDVNNFHRIDFSPDGNYLVSASKGKLTVWDSQFNESPCHIEGHPEQEFNAEFSPDSKHIVSINDKRNVIIWNLKQKCPNLDNLESSTELSPNKHRVLGDQDCSGEALRKKDCVSVVTYSTDGSKVAAGLRDGTVTIWDLQSGESKQFHTLKGGRGRIIDIQFSPDDKLLAASSLDSRVILWNVKKGTIYQSLIGHEGAVQSIVFKDNKKLATASSDKRVFIWDVKSGRKLHTLEGHRDAISSVTFTFDGNRLISGTKDGEVIVWNLDISSETLQALGCRLAGRNLTNEEWERHIYSFSKKPKPRKGVCQATQEGL